MALSLPYKEAGHSGGRGSVRPEALHLVRDIMYCTVLHCTALHYTTLPWTELHCTVLYYHCPVLNLTFIVVHCTAPYVTALGGFKASSQMSVLEGIWEIKKSSGIEKELEREKIHGQCQSFLV